MGEKGIGKPYGSGDKNVAKMHDDYFTSWPVRV